MPVSVRAELAGDRRFREVLTTRTSQRVVRAAMTRGAAVLLEQMQIHVSGPRPRRLDTVTGELRASFEADLSQLPNVVRVGTPIPFWPALHEEGKGGRRKRAFAAPSLAIALKRMPDFFIEEFENVVASAPGAIR